ncbi:hypothetical protein NX059_001990 [Plenodomus lindquistii]|nr:hypothetical protein NX059_001990 [Plenodomus lindquistii]
MSTSIVARTSGLWRATRTPTTRQLWRHAATRRYAVDSANDDPEWFQQLRAEMRSRETTYMLDDITMGPEQRLANTLSGFLPEKWCRPPEDDRHPVTPGHHLISFNPSLPPDRLLPDGTDMLHSPGDPWTRRMWAGGSITFTPDHYWSHVRGYILNQAMACAERIMDVRLRGQGDNAKIFVTIERRFARLDQLYAAYKNKMYGKSGKVSRKVVETHFKGQLDNDEQWGDAMLKERRELVFLKERSAAELEAIKAGHLTPVKYLDRPAGEPQLSVTLIPTRSLLFRFSALTFNAHLIHLDPEYARNVEGHRNLLVHGPLSLTLMLQAMWHHLRKEGQNREVLERIDYRNLAPLYCDEEMRICASKKIATESGSTWDVWIEGPTGGVAVKGTVQTAIRRREARKTQQKLKRKVSRSVDVTQPQAESGLSEGANMPVRR